MWGPVLFLEEGGGEETGFVGGAEQEGWGWGWLFSEGDLEWMEVGGWDEFDMNFWGVGNGLAEGVAEEF